MDYTEIIFGAFPYEMHREYYYCIKLFFECPALKCGQRLSLIIQKRNFGLLLTSRPPIPVSSSIHHR